MKFTTDKWERARLTREFLIENPSIYRRFERKALQIAAKGFKRYSAKTIICVLRFESDLRADPMATEGGEFKINDAIIATLAHDFMEDHPEMEAFFEMRQAAYVPRRPPPRVDEDGQGLLI